MSTHERGRRIREGYDKIARAYAERYDGELAHKPFDRALLDRFAERLGGRGSEGAVLDLGCGSGQIAAYLASRGLEAGGLDLSPEMIGVARALHPSLSFRVADMGDPGIEEGSLAGLVAFYSLIHISREEMPRVLTGLLRGLRPGGLFLLSFHLGEETLHLEEMLGEPVSIDFLFFQREEMEGYLTGAGFDLVEASERGPYAPAVESQTQRAYLLARRPA